jgi:hypothetical protein
MDTGYSSQERDGSRKAISSVREKALRVQASLEELFTLAQNPVQITEQWVEHFEGITRQLRILREATSEARILENWVVRPLTANVAGGMDNLLRTKLEPFMEKRDIALDEQEKNVGDVERQIRVCNKLIISLENALENGISDVNSNSDNDINNDNDDSSFDNNNNQKSIHTTLPPPRKRIRTRMDDAVKAFQVGQERPSNAPHPFDALLRLYKKGKDEDVDLRLTKEELDKAIETQMLLDLQNMDDD